jgi:hypothetical protein
MLDSLVRVSRRVEENHLVIIIMSGNHRNGSDPDTQSSVHPWVLPKTFTIPQKGYHVPGVFLKSEPMLTHKARNTTGSQIKTSSLTYAKATSHPLCMQQSRQADWFHSLPFQQFQALLTLFSKSFSPFPHGTCLLSVSSQYLALDEIYHPIYAPVPRNATLRRHAVHRGLQMKHRILTHVDALFQEAYTCASVGNTSRGYNSRPEAPISMPSLSLFIRHY